MKVNYLLTLDNIRISSYAWSNFKKVKRSLWSAERVAGGWSWRQHWWQVRIGCSIIRETPLHQWSVRAFRRIQMVRIGLWRTEKSNKEGGDIVAKISWGERHSRENRRDMWNFDRM